MQYELSINVCICYLHYPTQDSKDRENQSTTESEAPPSELSNFGKTESNVTSPPTAPKSVSTTMTFPSPSPKKALIKTGATVKPITRSTTAEQNPGTIPLISQYKNCVIRV